MAQASGTRTEANPDPAPRRRRRGREIAGLTVGIAAGLSIALGWAISTRGHAPAPVVYSTHPPVLVPAGSAAGPARPSPDPAALDAQWAAYSDHASCADWAGGDGVSAIRLNSSQLAWFFSDTYLGPASRTTGFSHLSGFLHNSVVVQTTSGAGSAFVTLTGGGACAGPGGRGDAAPVVGAPPTGSGVSADRYWEEDGIRVGGAVLKFYQHYLGGAVPFVPDGTVVATFGVSQLGAEGRGHQYGAVVRPNLVSLPSYTPPAGGSPILWGAALLRTGNTVYVYGTQTPDGAAAHVQLYLARVPAWSAVQGNARPVQPPGSSLAVTSGFSVIGAAGRYWMIEAGTAIASPDVVAYPASAPWGPFDAAAGRVLYRDPSIGLDAAHNYRIMYEARAEPALSSRGTLMISYNVNSEGVTTACTPMSAYTNTVTLPQFVAVPMAAFGAAQGPQATAGAPDIPQIVQRHPSQWFDSWDFPSGCPPMPGLMSVQASPGRGQVTLSWPDVGLGMRYDVSLQGPGRVPMTIAYHNGATITGLAPGEYQATVVPVNFRKVTGTSAEVTFTVR